MTDEFAKPARQRCVVVVEYDVTGLTPKQVDALLFGALASYRDVSFKVEIPPGVGGPQ